VLFLVDRANLGKQALNEFQQFTTPDDGRKFTELYNVQRLTSPVFDPACKVYITTIQRLFSMLDDKHSFDPDAEERSLFESGAALDGLQPVRVEYKPAVPIEFFDHIVVDECHRSIYNLWRQVLEYFDAHLTGLTATPAKHTFGFFKSNLVMEYTRPRAVVDGVNVDGQVYRIETKITGGGAAVEAGEWVQKRDRQTRARRDVWLEDDLIYGAKDLDRAVVAEDQIRLVIRTFRDKLFTEMFPDRTHVPKTLIFAKDDNHAEEIVKIVREEFHKGNDFCQKITYRVTGVKTDDLIAQFRTRYNPRIVVTVDLIATGTDIKPLEVLLFMRSVKSRVLFEQMLGRGTRVINATDLIAVTPDAKEKTRFVIVDAVGVVEDTRVETQNLEQRRSVAFDALLEQVQYSQEDDILTSLAGRLAWLDKHLTADERAQIVEASGGATLHDLATALLDATDPDRYRAAAIAATGNPKPSAEQIAEAEETLRLAAAAPFDHPALRDAIKEAHRRDEQTIDAVSRDELLAAGFSAADTETARATVESFRAYLDENRDEIAAFQLLYERPHGERQLTYDAVKDLAARLRQPPRNWTPDALWQAYAQLERDKVRGVGARRVLTDLVSLVRHATTPDDAPELVPYPDTVRARYEAWLAQSEAGGAAWTPEQRQWLDRIAAHIGVNLRVALRDLQEAGEFPQYGGIFRAQKVFGEQRLPALLDELNDALVA